MDPRAYLRVLRRNLVLLLVCTAVCVGLAGYLTYRATPEYQSTARVFVSAAQADTSDAYAGGLLSEQRVSAYVELVESRLLARQVQDELGLVGDLDDLSDKVTASVVNETVVLELVVTDDDPRQAQELAQSYATNLVQTALEIETPPGRAVSPINATIIDPASFSPEAVSPRPAVNLALAGTFGLLLGLALALAREALDNTVKTAEDLQPNPVPLLSSIVVESSGSRGRLLTDLGAEAPRAEAFRVLRTNIQFIDVDEPQKVFVITSALQGEGKTSIAVNLALSLAQAGVKTLLVDGDLRRPRVAGLLGLDESIGVTTVLLGRVGLEEAIQRHGLTDLDVLTSGTSPPNASELLQSKAMAALLDDVRNRYDLVLFDAPPLLPVTDAALLASRADGALLVVRHGKTTREQYQRSVERLSQVDAAPVGVVMNMVPPSRSVLGYTYRSYESRRRTPGRHGRRG